MLVGEGLRIGEDVVLLRIERVGLRLRQRLAVAAGVAVGAVGGWLLTLVLRRSNDLVASNSLVFYFPEQKHFCLMSQRTT